MFAQLCKSLDHQTMQENELQARRRQRLKGWLEAHGGWAAVMRDRGLSSSYGAFISSVIGGYSFGSRAARTAETRLGMPPLHLDHEEPGISLTQDAQFLILDAHTVEPRRVDWDQLMQTQELPPTFALEMPDDAMAPATPSGTLLYMRATSSLPRPGTGALVQDRSGRRYVRRVQQAPNGAWLAAASDPDYATLHSVDDGLTVLAEVTGRRVSTGEI